VIPLHRVWRTWRGVARQPHYATSTKRDTPVQYNTSDARDLFSHLLRRVRRGEEIVVAHAGTPIAKIIPFNGSEPTRPGVIRAHLVLHDAPPDEE
jgi:prevent-host-death family protein